jgi:hypothetical protein
MDNTSQRQNVANNAVKYVQQITDALYQLQLLSDQRAKFSAPFDDTDFENGAMNPQLTAGIIGTFFDFVFPSLMANYEDAANGGRNEQIMLQMRQG